MNDANTPPGPPTVDAAALDAAMAVFDRNLKLMAPPRYLVAEALAAAGQASGAEEVRDLRALFEMQWTRMGEATERWRAEDPEARALTLPDLGALLAWLMADADRARDDAEALRTQLYGSYRDAGDPMPVFVLKAKDRLAVSAVSWYRRLCESEGLDDQAAQVRLAAAEMSEWRERNPEAVQTPDHSHVPAT